MLGEWKLKLKSGLTIEVKDMHVDAVDVRVADDSSRDLLRVGSILDTEVQFEVVHMNVIVPTHHSSALQASNERQRRT